MKKYKALFFDFDDTLFDFKKSETIALEESFEHFGIEKSEEMFSLYDEENQAYWRAFEKGIYKGDGDSSVRFKNFCRRIEREDIDGDEMCEYYITQLSKTAFEIENSVSLLEKLSKDYDIYIVTNSLKKVNDSRSEVGGILPFIKGRFISEAIGVSKPRKGFFDYCFEHIDAEKEDVLLIGDSLISDIKGAVEYGIDSCWYNRKKAANNSGLTPTYEIGSLWDLEKII